MIALWLRRLHGWLTVVWVIALPLAFVFGWLKSVTFVSLLSIYALAVGHFSSWQSSRVEVRQEEIAEEEETTVEGDPG